MNNTPFLKFCCQPNYIKNPTQNIDCLFIICYDVEWGLDKIVIYKSNGTPMDFFDEIILTSQITRHVKPYNGLQ